MTDKEGENYLTLLIKKKNQEHQGNSMLLEE